MRNLVIQTKDYHRIELDHYEQGSRKVVILAHGFFNNKDAYLFQEIAKAVAAHYDVVSFDFRGHGKSSGLFTWTARECADLEAVINYAQKHGYEATGLIGFSLGAAISLIESARNPEIKTVIAVSAPYDFWQINFHFWEPGMIDDLKLNLGMKGKGKGIRPGNIFDKKIKPLNVVDRISPRPVLFIHGEDDWLIKSSHSQRLFDKAREPKGIKILENLGHAETMFDQNPQLFMKTCLDWFKDNL